MFTIDDQNSFSDSPYFFSVDQSASIEIVQLKFHSLKCVQSILKTTTSLAVSYLHY